MAEGSVTGSSLAASDSTGRMRGVRRPRRGGRRAATTTMLQLEAAECGAASLGMILGYYGRYVPLERLRELCGVSRDGSKASAVLKAARSFGLEAKGLKAEPEHLLQIPMPAIAFVNFCHFLVVEGVRGNWVYLNDPADGRRRVGLDEFDAMFTGVILTFAPTPGFVPGDDRSSESAALFARTRGVRIAVIYAVLASLALIVPGLALPVMARIFVDYILIQDLGDWLLPLVAGMLATAAVRYLLVILRDWCLVRAETRLAVDGARELFDHMLRLPITFFGARYAGEIASRLDLSDGLARLLTGHVAMILLNLFTASFFLVLMAAYDTGIAAIVLALSLINIMGVAVVSRGVAEGHRKVALDQGKLVGVTLAGLRDIETFKASGAESSFFSRWSGLNAKVVSANQDIGRHLGLLAALPALINALVVAAVLVAGGWQIMRGEMTIGMLVAVQTLAASFMAPVTALTDLGGKLQQVRSFTERTNDVLCQRADPATERSDRLPDILPRGGLRMRNVSFGYIPLEAPFIADFSLDIPSGSSIALVGPSGSGKSTLARLIAGLIEPGSGTVELDGKPLRDWPRQAVAGIVAYIDQDIVLFEGSIRENLVLWDDTVPSAQVFRAAHDAAMHDVISKRPGTYESAVAENGRNFSGGQRQRLEIARALSTNPRVLIMDEATSALDTITEALIMENIRARGATLVIVAHRLSTIRDCDEIIVLERGVPVERGNHEALIALGGWYARLVEA